MIKTIPLIGIGTWLVQDENILFKTIKAGIKKGYKHIDTAQIYNNEYQIGRVLKKLKVDQGNLFITSKVSLTNIKYHAYDSTKESIRRLGIQYIDLMLLHTTIDREANKMGYKQLMKAREEGLIKHIGVSNYGIQNLKDLKKDTGEYPYINQIVLAPTTRAVELEKFCKKNKIKLTGYSIMKSYADPNPFFERSAMTESEKKVVDKIAWKHNKDVGQVLNHWAIQLGYTVIPKSNKVERTISNFEILDFQLSAKEMKNLNSMNRFSEADYMKQIEVWRKNWKEKTPEEIDRIFKKGLLFVKNYKLPVFGFKGKITK